MLTPNATWVVIFGISLLVRNEKLQLTACLKTSFTWYQPCSLFSLHFSVSDFQRPLISGGRLPSGLNSKVKKYNVLFGVPLFSEEPLLSDFSVRDAFDWRRTTTSTFDSHVLRSCALESAGTFVYQPLSSKYSLPALVLS